MRLYLILLLAICAQTVIFAEDISFPKTRLLDADKKHEPPVVLTLSDSGLRIQSEKLLDLTVPYTAVQRLSYAFLDRRRIAEGAGVAPLIGVFAIPLLFTKSQSHWLVVDPAPDASWKTLLLRLDKRDYRVVLAVLNAGSGKKVEVFGAGSASLDPTLGSHDEDQVVEFPLDRVASAMREAMTASACKVGKTSPGRIECHRGLHGGGRGGWGGEAVTATLEPRGQATHVAIQTERGLGRNWSSPIFRELVKRLQTSAPAPQPKPGSAYTSPAASPPASSPRSRVATAAT